LARFVPVFKAAEGGHSQQFWEGCVRNEAEFDSAKPDGSDGALLDYFAGHRLLELAELPTVVGVG
jgi:hypothetical protein